MKSFALIFGLLVSILGVCFAFFALITGHFVDAVIGGIISYGIWKLVILATVYTTTNSTPSASQISRM